MCREKRKGNVVKKILLLTTGGTIASRHGEGGLTPTVGSVDLLALMPELAGLFHIETREIFRMDSSNVQPEEWQKLARVIYESRDMYDGVIVTHGTDTMAYTASALSFMLQNLDFPVVLTGAQVPIEGMFTDARRNMQSAFAAVESGICGVSIAFGDRIMQGNRAVKVRTMGFSAFESISKPNIAEIYADGVHMTQEQTAAASVQAEMRRKRLAGSRLILKDRLCTDIFLLKLIPGTNPDIFDRLYEMKYRGIVIEAFGAGGTHFLRRNLLAKLAGLTEKGVSVVVCSQCLYEKSDLSLYEVGHRLMECRVIPGLDMTTEAIVTKLMWALGQTDDPSEVREIFATDLAGEVTLSGPQI